MTIQDAIEFFAQHQKSTVKKSTLKSYGKFLDKVQERFLVQEVVAVSADDISKSLEACTGDLSRSTRHLRYAQLKAFFNYVIEDCDLNIKNPCNAKLLFKTFKNVRQSKRVPVSHSAGSARFLRIIQIGANSQFFTKPSLSRHILLILFN